MWHKFLLKSLTTFLIFNIYTGLTFPGSIKKDIGGHLAAFIVAAITLFLFIHLYFLAFIYLYLCYIVVWKSSFSTWNHHMNFYLNYCVYMAPDVIPYWAIYSAFGTIKSFELYQYILPSECPLQP